MESLVQLTAPLAVGAGITLVLAAAFNAQAAESVDLSKATVVIAGDKERVAAGVLVEEVEKRTGLRWPVATRWPERGPVVALTCDKPAPAWPQKRPASPQPLQPEGYHLSVGAAAPNGWPGLWIVGADTRGLLYGVGHVLRHLEWEPNAARFPAALDVTTVPVYPVRGHQLGFRPRANSYDAWDVAQYEQYIRELALFGLNAVENIPFEDTRPSPVMRVARDEMNIAIGEICQRYDLAYWIWVPALFDLGDAERRAKELEHHDAFFEACPRLDAFFFPGGDPGNNPPELVMPFLEEVAARLAKYHPEAKAWLSMQGFDREQCFYVIRYLEEHDPDWFGGIVAGPSSPPIPLTRKHLPERYPVRHYPDITHTVRCQYENSWWDPAFALTLGREPCNPQPAFYAHVHNFYAPYTDGSIAYSDGVHDDVNKVIWLARGWDPNADVRDILIEYTRCFFGPDVAEQAADGILALEKNWEGPLALNGGVDATLALWQQLGARKPDLADNWRWQLCLLRAHYDAYTRHRLLYEQQLEEQANTTLARAEAIGAEAAMDAALRLLGRAETEACRPELRARIETLCDALFASVGLQTSVEKYHGSSGERGCILDYVDHPLNNRWWLEDEFAKIRALDSDAAKRARLEQIRTWEHPGPGSFYDDVGNVAKSPHVVRGEGLNTDPEMLRNPSQCHWWWDNGFSRTRLSWQVSMEWPLALRYEGLDPDATYVLRMTGYGDAFPRMGGQRVEPTLYGKGIGEFKEFPVPPEAVEDGILIVTWDKPDEDHLNWREQSRISEAWLTKGQ